MVDDTASSRRMGICRRVGGGWLWLVRAGGDLGDHGFFFGCWRVEAQVGTAPPPVEDMVDARQIEVLIGLGERDAQLGFELGQLVGSCGGQGRSDGRPAALNGHVHAQIVPASICRSTSALTGSLRPISAATPNYPRAIRGLAARLEVALNACRCRANLGAYLVRACYIRGVVRH